MKLKVLRPFINKENKKQVFEAGAVIDIDDAARVNDIVKRGLGEVIIEQSAVENPPAEGDASGDQPKEVSPTPEKVEKAPAEGKKSKKTKKEKKESEDEQPATGDAVPTESEQAKE